MNRRRGAILLAAAVIALAIPLLLAATGEARRSDDPVVVSVTAPKVVAAKTYFKVRFRVSADAGALGIANGQVRLRARLEPECGGSYAGTVGPKVIDRGLAAPPAGAPLSFKTKARIRVKKFAPQTVCAFVEDTDGRQFATSVEVPVVVSRPCTKATRRLTRLRRAVKHADGARHRRLASKVKRARKRQRRACKVGKTTTSSP